MPRRTFMPFADGHLPSSLATTPLSARQWIALGAGLGVAACAYAGLYPQVDGGRLRIVLALTTAPFAAAVVATSLGARTPLRAFALTIVHASILGVAATVLPATLMGGGAYIFGVLFGAPTGALYGVPLAVLTAIGHRHVRQQTHDASDRAARTAGVWLFFIAPIALLTTLTFDASRIERLDANAMLPAFFAVAVGLGGLLAAVRAFARLRHRAAWLDRVRSGLEPSFRLRPVDARDRLEGLPRLSDGVFRAGLSVVEWRPDPSTGAVYRVAATGQAVAIDGAP